MPLGNRHSVPVEAGAECRWGIVLRKGIEVMGQEPRFDRITEDTTLFVRVVIILCWCWDDKQNGKNAIRALGLLPKLLAGETESFWPQDWLLFYQALGVWPERDALLDELYQISSLGVLERLPPGATKVFP